MGLSLALLVASFIRPLQQFGFPLASLATVSAIALLLRRPDVWTSISNNILARHLSFVGLISYSVYLIHQPLLKLVPDFLQVLLPGVEIHPAIIFHICLLLWVPILGLAWLFYRAIEVPSMNVGKRFLRKSRPSAGQLAPSSAV